MKIYYLSAQCGDADREDNSLQTTRDEKHSPNPDNKQVKNSTLDCMNQRDSQPMDDTPSIGTSPSQVPDVQNSNNVSSSMSSLSGKS